MKHSHLMILFLPLLFYSKSVAQTKPADSLVTKHLYVDVHGGLWTQGSINYEKYITSKLNVNLYGRLGLGYSGNAFDGDQGPGILAGFTMLTGKRNSHFELSAGAFFISHWERMASYIEPGIYVHPVVNVGYRYQKPEGGFIFKSYLGPLGIGIGLGHAF